MDKAVKSVLAFDGGGLKGVYGLSVLNNFNRRFSFFSEKKIELYAGTSIGAVICAALASNINPDYLLKIFREFELEGPVSDHRLLYAQVPKVLNSVFENRLFGEISEQVFFPIYDHTLKRKSHFGWRSELNADNEFIRDILAATCADIRVSPAHYINSLRSYYIDGGIFSYDPIAYLLRLFEYPELSNLNILSIGSGVIANLVDSLNVSPVFDTIYDSFLFEQFETLQTSLKWLKISTPLNYNRITEFCGDPSMFLNFNELISAGNLRADSFQYSQISKFLR